VTDESGPVARLTGALLSGLFFLLVVVRPLYDVWMGY
jgi:hypothetical protein